MHMNTLRYDGGIYTSREARSTFPSTPEPTCVNIDRTLMQVPGSCKDTDSK